MPWSPFASFTLSFCNVLLKSSWFTFEPRLLISEASHMCIKIKQTLFTCKCAKGAPSTSLMCRQTTIKNYESRSKTLQNWLFCNMYYAHELSSLSEMRSTFNSPLRPTSNFRRGDVLGPFLRVCLGHLNSNIHPWKSHQIPFDVKFVKPSKLSFPEHQICCRNNIL